MKDLERNSWRIFRIMAEFVEGYEMLQRSDPCVVVFGSARMRPEHPVYQQAIETGRLLAEAGYTVITGGGPGIMEAVNKGAFEAGGVSIGFNITLPFEQATNKYLTHSIEFDYFFIRKAMFAYYSQAFITFPGGFGTMDEFFDILTLIQTEKLDRKPFVVYNRQYHELLYKWLKDFVMNDTASAKDLELFQFADTPEEVLRLIVGDNDEQKKA